MKFIIILKKEITVVYDIIELRATLPEFDRGTHFVDRVKGNVKEQIQLFQREIFGALFGARCKFHKPDENNDEVMGFNTVTDGTQINTITHLSAATQYGDAMSSFQKYGVDGLAFLYNRHLKELTVKVRYDSHVVEYARTGKFLPKHNISNLSIWISGHRFVVDGVPL
jgi:hypothetical protein